MTNCGNCTHWGTEANCGHEVRMCQRIGHKSHSDAVIPMAYTEDNEDYNSGLYTKADFGCVLFEAKSHGEVNDPLQRTYRCSDRY